MSALKFDKNQARRKQVVISSCKPLHLVGATPCGCPLLFLGRHGGLPLRPIKALCQRKQLTVGDYRKRTSSPIAPLPDLPPSGGKEIAFGGLFRDNNSPSPQPSPHRGEGVRLFQLQWLFFKLAVGSLDQLGQATLGAVELLLAAACQGQPLLKERDQFAQGMLSLFQLGDDCLDPLQSLLEAPLLRFLLLRFQWFSLL